MFHFGSMKKPCSFIASGVWRHAAGFTDRTYFWPVLGEAALRQIKPTGLKQATKKLEVHMHFQFLSELYF